jgi:hypothetical protein
MTTEHKDLPQDWLAWYKREYTTFIPMYKGEPANMDTLLSMKTWQAALASRTEPASAPVWDTLNTTDILNLHNDNIITTTNAIAHIDAHVAAQVEKATEDHKQVLIELASVQRRLIESQAETVAIALYTQATVQGQQSAGAGECVDCSGTGVITETGKKCPCCSTVKLPAIIAATQSAEKAQGMVEGLEFDGYYDSDEHYGKTILDLVRSRLETYPNYMAERNIFYVSACWTQPQEWRVVRGSNPLEVERVSPPAVVTIATHKATQPVDDLAMLTRELVRALSKASPDSPLIARTMDYLKRKGLQGSPLRADQTTEE